MVASFDPPPGNVFGLPRIIVTFSKLVAGVEAADLTINDAEAQSVSGSGDQYTFTFSAVPTGQVTVEWSQDHGITDTEVPPNPFDSTIPGEVRIYVVADELAPTVAETIPPPDLTLRSLRELSVTFSEPVTGLDADDLLLNGRAASAVTGSEAGPYLFTFDGAGAGSVTISWANDHGITDFAAEPNPFAGDDWEYTIDPNGVLGDLAINEFISSNRSGRLDEDGEASDWIELWNFGNTTIELEGWSLSDDPDIPGKFVLPARTLAPGAYLVIVASGKDRAPSGSAEIHTNFKLAASGEHLGLYTPELPRAPADELFPEFPTQRNDYSYGRDAGGNWRYYRIPTPGRPNGSSQISGLLAPPHVNAERGFYSQPFEVHLTSDHPGATIRYTTDGSEPTVRNGERYVRPIRIGRTAIIRAAAFADGFLPSEIITHTYLYDVSAAIQSLPVVSLVTDDSNLWGSTGIQQPGNAAQRGIAWERPVSAELIKSEDNSGLQVNCGLRVQGGNYVRGRYSRYGGLPFSKYSFRLYFRGDYGPTMLHYPWFEGSEVQEFDRITLRAGMNDHSNPFIVDELVRRLQIDTGQVGARGNFVNLFINGEYKGYYNSTERIDDDFMRSWHGGDNDWDVVAQFGEVREGDATQWYRMRDVVNRDLRVPSNYRSAHDFLDIDNFIDYLLVNVYAGTGDWPHNNWRAARERLRGRDVNWRFYVWDAEWAFGNLGRSVSGNTLSSELGGGSEIAQLYQSLVQSPEFRLRWADRVHKHFYNEGALTDERITARYEEMRAEMARVLPNMSSLIANTWIPNRRGNIMRHMASANLHRSDAAPLFTQHGGHVPAGFELRIRARSGLPIYYTLDGTDPRRPLDRNNLTGTATLVTEEAAKRILIPSPANGGSAIGLAWTGGTEPFDDSDWTAGSGGIGFDEAPDFDPHIDLEVEETMKDQNSSCYVRIPFTLTAADLVDANLFQLNVRYDDGFVAYLNGVRIADANAGDSVVWNSSATESHADSEAVELQGFDVTDFLDELVIGPNILAIHGLNDSAGGVDFLNAVTLEMKGNLTGTVSATAREYDGLVPISGTTIVKARTLSEGVWSALTEAEFFTIPEAPAIRITEIMYDPDGGRELEFIELQIVGNRTIDLGHMQFEGINFSFPPETFLGPGELLVLSSNDDPDAFLERYPGVTVFGTFGGSLSNGGERLALLDGLGRTIVSVDYRDTGGWPTEPDGEGPSLVLIDPDGDPDDPANWTASAQSGGSPGAAEPAFSQPLVFINEVLADNQSALENGGSFPPMIELYNPSGVSRSLAGWGLSNNGGDPLKYTFPAGTRINGLSHLVIWCDNAVAAPGLHCGFGLNPEGESLFLSDSAGDRVDAFSFGLQVADLSVSKSDTGWQLTTPTPGDPNEAAVPLAAQSQLAINEWLANRISGQSDWLELYNRDPENPAALRDLHLGNGETTFRYGALSFLAPGGFARMWADEGIGAEHLDFRLPAEGSTLSLTDAHGLAFESVSYPAQNEDISRGRLPDGSATILNFPNAASPGAPNYRSDNPGLVFNELLAVSGGLGAGWLELRNDGDALFSLTGFSLSIGDRDGPRWQFPDGLTVSINDHLAIACDGSRPAASVPNDLNTGVSLSAQGGTVYLFDDAGHEIDRLLFGSQIMGRSIGRPSDAGNWALLSNPTPEATNSESAPLGSANSVRLNEWLANSPAGADDFVELHNPSGEAMDVSGLRLTDDLSTAGIDRFIFPALSYIGAGGFVVLIADNSPSPGHLPFSLDADGETLRINHSSRPGVLDEVTWDREEEGISSGLLTDGGNTVGQLAFLSPGQSNTSNPNLDSDGDGIPDSWEDANGLDKTDPSDSSLDRDHDLRTNLFEYISGTDPQDLTSFLAIDSMRFDHTGFTLEFTARAGVRYTVELSDDLTSWRTLATIEPPVVDQLATPRDLAAASHRFYRLVAERP